jgi:hypothetical protein
MEFQAPLSRSCAVTGLTRFVHPMDGQTDDSPPPSNSTAPPFGVSRFYVCSLAREVESNEPNGPTTTTKLKKAQPFFSQSKDEFFLVGSYRYGGRHLCPHDCRGRRGSRRCDDNDDGPAPPFHFDVVEMVMGSIQQGGDGGGGNAQSC